METATNTASASSSSCAAPAASSSAAGAASSSSAAPAASSSAEAGPDAAGRPSPPPSLPTAGRPQSLEPNNAPAWVPGASASSSSTAAPKAASGSSASSAGPSAATVAPEPYSNEEDCGEILRPKVNPALSKTQVEALVFDDFLLATDLKAIKAPEKAAEADETFAQLDVALRHRDFNVAEALWKRMVSLGTASAAQSSNRAIASRYVSAMHPRIQTELESAIDRKDINAAEREHQRLSDLRDSCKETRVEIVDVTTDRIGRNAELEAKYQQLCNKSGPLVCNLFPRVSVNGCMNQNGQEACVIL